MLRSTPILHHVLTNYANLIDNEKVAKYYQMLKYLTGYYLVKNAYGTLLLMPNESLDQFNIKDRMKPWFLKSKKVPQINWDTNDG